MPDLTIVTMQQCTSWKGITGKVKGYTQTGVGTPWPHCTCPAFKYGKGFDKTCKHVKELELGMCQYHEQFDGPPEQDGVCPKCGRPTMYVRVGV